MSNNYILAHDIGTSGTKSSLVRSDGVVEVSHTTPHATRTPSPGWAEQDPLEWWQGVCQNTQSLIARRPDLRDRVAAIGVSGQMMGCVALDKEGNVLRPSMIHSDVRATAECREADERVGADVLYRRTGNILDPRSTLCKILWLRKHEPDVYDRTARFVQSKDYIVGRMVGEFESSDLSDGTHGELVDVVKKCYIDDIFVALGIDAARFPPLYRSIDIVGKLTPSAGAELGLPAGIPVSAGGGDGPCASVGAGVVRPGDTYCCVGTTAWISSVVAEPYIDEKQRVFDILALDGDTCGLFGTIQCAGRAVDWIMGIIGEEDFTKFDALLSSVAAGSDGLIFLPYLEGERSPIFDANARGVFFGLTPEHQRQHLLRATIEGVSFALRSVLDVMREALDVRALRLIGGGGQSAAWQQILADVCGVKVQLLSTQAPDATSLGAAIAAGVGVGLFADLAEGVQTIKITAEREPDLSRKDLYAKQFDVYTALYPRLRPIYERLQRHLHEVESHS